MNKEQLANFIKVASGGRARIKHSTPPTEQDQAVALLVVHSRADLAKMSPRQRRAAILRGSF